MEREFVIAHNIGFCPGVKRAIDMALSLAKKHGSVYTYGELIHNNSVIADLERHNIRAISSIDEAEPGSIVLIRAHGVPLSVYSECEKRGVRVSDATCPFVKKIHGIVAQNCKNRRIIIIGTKNHPETIGIAGNCDGAYIVQDESDICGIGEGEKLCIVSQTTFMREKFLMLAGRIREKNPDVTVFDTTCNTTRVRQEEAECISRTCDTMLVFGSYHSSNTKKLAEICRRNCANVYFAEHIGEDGQELHLTGRRIGVVGGASTPENLITDAVAKLKNSVF